MVNVPEKLAPEESLFSDSTNSTLSQIIGGFQQTDADSRESEAET